jgi:hypothetical protein
MSQNKPSLRHKLTGMGSNDSSSVKVDGFPREEGDMSKKPKRIDRPATQEAIEAGDPISEMVAAIKQEQHDRLLACIPKEGKLHSEPSGTGTPSTSITTYDPWTDTVSRVVRTDETGKVVEDYKPIPREDEARPCTLCESRRPIGTSYSRVYCTKSNVRYCKCSYCGHTWPQERK